MTTALSLALVTPRIPLSKRKRIHHHAKVRLASYVELVHFIFALNGSEIMLKQLANVSAAKAFQLATDSKYREFHHLLRMEGKHGTTTLVDGGVLAFHDGLACARQHLVIFKQGLYATKDMGARPVILDVGANIGMASLYFKKQYPECQLEAFEPDPRLASLFKRNLSSFGYSVQLHEAAVSDHDGLMKFKAHEGDGGRLSSEGDVDVKVCRLRDFLDRKVDLLKIDIEGAELDVLNDCADRLHNVSRLFVEYHSWADQPQRLAELLALLQRSGFRVQIQTDHCAVSPFLGADISDGMDLRLNIFAMKDESEGRWPSPIAPTLMA